MEDGIPAKIEFCTSEPAPDSPRPFLPFAAIGRFAIIPAETSLRGHSIKGKPFIEARQL
jgi:hypothetical protein